MSAEKKVEQKKENEALRLLSSISKSVNARLLPPAGDAPEAGCKDVLDKWPLMHTAVFAPFQEGGPTEGATLILWGSDRGLTCLVNLKWLTAKAYFTATTLQELFQAVEDALADPEFNWQRDRPAKGGWKKRKGYGNHRG